MWIGTGGNEWVEAGLTHGVIAGVNHGRAFFWAEQNSVGTYAEHFVQTISLNTSYTAKISHSGSGSWGVYLNGTNVGGSSHNHGTSANLLQTGAEAITNDALLTGTSTSLQKRGPMV